MRDLWPFLKLYGRHKWSLFLGILIALMTLLFSIGLLGLSGWFITATSLAGLTYATSIVFDFFSPGAGVRGFSIGRTASRYFERLISHGATFKLLAWLRSWFFLKLLPLSLIRRQRYRSGELLNRLVADIDALDQLYLRLVSPVVAVVMVTALLSSALCLLSPTLGTTAFALLGFWLLLLPALFYRLGLRSGQKLGALQGQLRQTTLDYLRGMGESQIYGTEPVFRSAIEATEHDYHRVQASFSRLDGLGLAMLTLGAGFSVLTMLYMGVGEYQSGRLSGPVMVMSVFSVLASFEAMMPLPAAFQILGYTRLAARRLQEVLDEKPVEFGRHVLADEAPEVGNTPVVKKVPDISFQSVSYRYSTQQRWVLKDVHLHIAAGEHVALLGKTGCGKSTLIRLLTRQLMAQPRTVMIGGAAVESLSEASLFSTLTVIPQKTHVFSATLRDNLRMAKPSATDDALLRIVSEVGLDSLQGGTVGGGELNSDVLNLWLGEGGNALSGGEQRRLAIARALLHDSAVLIMDEPGEGLDPVSEARLMEKVIECYQGRTLLLITHKQVMLERMNRVVRMEAGHIIDVG